MAFVFEMPEVGEGVVEAEVVEWKVSVGDSVNVDQPLCEITTDKASLEISSPKAGTILKLFGEPGDIIKVHTPLVELETGAAAAPSNGAAEAVEPADVPVAAPRAAAPPAAVSDPATRTATKATPAVRRRSRELGVDLARVAGTGPGGRVTHTDLEAFAAVPAPAAVAPRAQVPHTAPVSTPAPAPLPMAPPPLAQVAPSTADQRIKIIGIRRKIAQQMVRAAHTAPHFTYVEEADCTRLVELRKQLKPRAEARGVKLSFLPFFAKACSMVFREFPNVNARMDEEAFELVVRGEHHIGFACDTPSGLMVPVVRNVESKSILRIAWELQDLFARTRVGKASLQELSGSTFTITGVGNIGGVLATPILNVPEVAILGINQIKARPVVHEGEIAIRQMTYLSPSFDHRIIDGAVGARFTAGLKEVIENPESMLLELS